MSCCSATYSEHSSRCNILLHNLSGDCDCDADCDCDCNCDTWVQTSRLLPPDNALIALQRQPVGDQSSYCSGVGPACLPSLEIRYSFGTVLLLYCRFLARKEPHSATVPNWAALLLVSSLSLLPDNMLWLALLPFLSTSPAPSSPSALLSVLLSCLVGVLFAAAAGPGEWERALHYCRTSLCTWLTGPAVYLSLSRCPSVLLSCCPASCILS